MPGSKAGRPLKDDEDCMAGYEHRSEQTIASEIFRAASDVLSGHFNVSGGNPEFK